MKITTKLWIGLGVLAVISPIGLLLPEKFKAGDAWGEWGPEKFKDLVGYIPHGLERLSTLWNAVFPDYAFKGWEDKGMGHLSLAYILSAVIGIALCAGIAYLLGKFLMNKNK
jgi:cobalt/nickel transport protein